METRINLFENGQRAIKAMSALGAYLTKSTIEQSLFDLIYFRVSQINGCAFCLDMHSKDLRANGESEQRLYVMDAWRETPFFTDRERAALAWAEAVTKITNGQISDEVFNEITRHFSEAEIVDLTVATNTINNYNRINIAFRPPVGTYVVGQFSTAH
ncbi:carboxymuconolactone decarboxylase family protein [Mucilaginibacter sp. L3T2-6]|uniref:carboxymuconolactone decarboxylase family protein n=1 Tax=Mucilaginibacter sp. L3T2-6 TaxID=3062491 RepID=UPI0026754F24|nr:carboxymuconolactone decarboxylase family protein [Mucilaginibacter sp. L3T2-6]MDO3644997.1 carboxymuconolactone decarboxylase family protein [Mucilaginibacter sp. L3T2-6]MDV6217448.1 carboxymuconolactone decarboxylase family protein [Mucilaginibacter sp. L3T2-6]